jgi:hypothetical protein
MQVPTISFAEEAPIQGLGKGATLSPAQTRETLAPGLGLETWRKKRRGHQARETD